MRSVLSCLILLWCLVAPSFAQNSPATSQSKNEAVRSTDSEIIQKIEDDWLKGESTTDIAVFDRVLADDYVNLTPHGLGPTKAEIISHLQPRAGQTPPYVLETQDMRIFVLGDTAVAAYTKTYRAKENENILREDTTHIFRKEHGEWKLKISRASIRKDD